MALPPSIGLSLCAGGGGLDMGLGLAEPGFATACFVEIEEYPRSVLAAAQSAGYFHAAPIWDDLKRFNGRPWRGLVDTILAGYPCQPFSMAGQRKGEHDPRHLWPDVARIITEIQPRWVFLENVAGHLTLGLESVLRSLWEMGFTPAVGLFSAGETGAPHERQRVFILAHANGRDSGAERQQRGGDDVENTERARDWGGASDFDQPGRVAMGRRSAGIRCRDGASGADGLAANVKSVGHASGPGCGEGRAEPGLRSGREAPPGAGGAMADANPHADARGMDCGGAGGSAGQGQDDIQRGERIRPEPRGGSGILADAIGAAGHEGGAGQCVSGAGAHGQAPDWTGRRQPGVYPPGPGAHDAWANTLATAPDLAPAAGLADCIAWAGRLAATLDRAAQEAAEPALRRMADGLATRARALRLLGNGVAPLAAAYAYRALASAHGLGPVDLEPAEAPAPAADPSQLVRRLT